MRYIHFLAALVAVISLQAATATEAAASSSSLDWPVRGDVVTRYANGDDPYAGGQHRGIDIAAPVGTPVVAAAGGRVTHAGVAGSSGLTVTVRSGDGRWDVSYLHLSAASVREGATVDPGERIGAVGVSGRRSVERPHLHFGVRDAGSRHAYHDPLDLLPPVSPPAPEPSPPADAPAGAPVPVPPSAAPAAAPGPAAAAEPAPDAVASPSAAPASGAALAGSLLGSPAPAAPTLAEPRPVRGHGSFFESGSGSAGGLGFERSGAAGRSAAAAAVTSAGTSPSRGRRGSAGRGEHASRGADQHGSRGAAPSVPPARHSRTGRESAANPAPAGTADTRGAAASSAPRPASGSGNGPDLGWLAALVGCLAAALCLGRPDATSRAARRGTARVSDWLRPLTGRS